jgi:hypothetical protein
VQKKSTTSGGQEGLNRTRVSLYYFFYLRDDPNKMMVDTRCERDRIAHQRLIQPQPLCGKNLFWTAASHNLAATLL